MYEKEKCFLLDTALEIERCNLISLSGGNISMRMPDGNFLVTPSGMVYRDMIPGDVVLIDKNCKVVEGNRKPSSDSPALIYMFEHMPWINALIHTHQPYATAAAFIADQIPEFLVTLIDACKAVVNVAPFTPSSDIGMGITAVKYAGDASAVILKHHGVMAFGADMKEALYSAVYLEEAAKTFVLAKSMGAIIPELSPEHIDKEKAGWQDYGQK